MAGDVPADLWPVAALAELLRDKHLAEKKKAAREADPDSPWRAHDGRRLNVRTEGKLAFRLGDAVRDVGYGSSPSVTS